MRDARIPWTADEDLILRDGLAKGETFGMIGKRLERSRNACVGRAQRLGINQPENPRDILMAEMMADGATMNECATALGVSYASAEQRWLRIRRSIGWQAS